jgi:trk system potassium uptake protein TrkA
MAQTMRPESGIQRIRSAGGTVVAELAAPRSFLGRSIADVDVRRRYGVSVLMVKHADGNGQESLTPSPAGGYVFREGDVLLVLGPDEALRRLQVEM